MSVGAPYVDSWYRRTANPFSEGPPLQGETQADVAVLGAGYTGLTAALHLAERGYKVIVLEAQTRRLGARRDATAARS